MPIKLLQPPAGLLITITLNFDYPHDLGIKQKFTFTAQYENCQLETIHPCFQTIHKRNVDGI